MNITLNELEAEIKRLEQEIGYQNKEIQENSLAKYILESNGEEMLTTEEFDFGNTFMDLENNQEKLIIYKSVLAEKQAEIKINGKSIYYLMHTLEYNKNRLDTVNSCMKQKYSLKRCCSDTAHAAVYYEVNKVNYSKATLLEIKDVLEQDIATLEAQILKTNILTVVDI